MSGDFGNALVGFGIAGMLGISMPALSTARTRISSTNGLWITAWTRTFAGSECVASFRMRSSLQFINMAMVEAAAQSDRDHSVQFGTAVPLIMGVDVARFGDDASVLRFRRGRDARTV